MKFIALKTKDGELKGDIAFFAESSMSADKGFTSILQTKTAHGNISHWRRP